MSVILTHLYQAFFIGRSNILKEFIHYCAKFDLKKSLVSFDCHEHTNHRFSFPSILGN